MTEPRASGRDRILAAAEELFAERGFDRTSTARLATAAGVPQGLIFYHFETKEGLLLALIRERSSRTLADLVPAEPPADPRAAITELWARLCRLLGEQTPMHRIVFRESEHHPELRARAQEIFDTITEAVAGHLAAVTVRSEPGPHGGAPARRDLVGRLARHRRSGARRRGGRRPAAARARRALTRGLGTLRT